MESAYKVLKALAKARNGMAQGALKRRFPLLDIDAIILKLEMPGYISHKITGYKTRTTKISHDYNTLWYPTDLGIAALEQYLEDRPPTGSKRLPILLAIVCGACVIVFYMIFSSPPA
ncbi:MAG TPA: hypothetical protein DEB31_06665 [Clostridiales bacterium]|nr:hypothetical protein [Clostridiales bacterium]